MATVTTTITPTPVPFPYSGLPDVISERTGIPRGEQSFNENGTAITLAGVGDVQQLIVNCNLPPGYAYVFRECNAFNLATDATDWDSTAYLGFTDSLTGGEQSFKIAVEMASSGATQFGTRKIINSPIEPFRQVILPANGTSQIQAQLIWTNAVTNGAVGSLFFSCRFLQFDIEQAHHYAVNYPIPTR